MHKTLVLAILFSSCLKPRLFTINIPRQYQGYIFLVYGADTKNSKELQKRGEYIITEIKSPPVQFVSDEFIEDYRKMKLFIVEDTTYMLLTPSIEDERGPRVFSNRLKDYFVGDKA
jgi:hypothetical protein